MIIELHMLQNFVPSCLNRDDTNSPKECEFGGCRRARISSQCLKRAIRVWGKDCKDETSLSYFERLTEVPLAKRTHLIVSGLRKRLMKQEKPEEEATQVAIEFARVYSSKKGKMNDKKPEETSVLLFMSEKELDEAAARLVQFDWPDLLKAIEVSKLKKPSKGDEGDDEVSEKNTSRSPLKKFVDEWAKAIQNRTSAPDIALFGRMLADRPDTNIDAACQVAHAISTHKVGVEFDFYTAVDDLQPKEDTGAGMMGTVEFNSACFYRYANIDTKQLETNLDADGALVRKTIEAFIRASVQAIPSGKKNSFAQQNPPSLVFAVVRDSGAWSLANAFSHPVRTGGDRDLVKDSKDALVDYWERLKKVYGDKGIKEAAAYSLEDYQLDGIYAAGSLDGLIDRVNLALNPQEA